MKPRIFIGSSTEALDVAYAIQENLEFDSNSTVWTQGIFELSNNTLDDLINALNNFDFGIFVFKPDDISIIRNSSLNTVRDNVIFEMGLFIGKLGKKRVFFVLPESTGNFHLPTDLLGIKPGKYNSSRDDGNLKAALGPFCNQIRKQLKEYVYENLLDLENENDLIKKVASEKKDCWEYFLSAELLDARLIEINRSYTELEKGLVFHKSKTYELKEFTEWFADSLNDMIRLIAIFKKIFEQELIASFGKPGVAGNVYEIKSAIEKIHSILKELLAWEYELQAVKPPQELKKVTELMQGWSRVIIDEVNKYPSMIRSAFSPENLAQAKEINIALTFSAPPNTKKIEYIIEQVRISMDSHY